MSERLTTIFYRGLTWSFLVLWLLVAVISVYHTWLFFEVGNPMWLAGVMAVAFETGLALSLFSILMTDNAKSIIPWSLMVLLTIVQVCGNVFSVYKYMIESKTDAYQYITGSFLHWFTDDMPQSDVMSIIAIMLGGILPVVCLFMTDMVASNFKLRMKTGDNATCKAASPETITKPEDLPAEKVKEVEEPEETVVPDVSDSSNDELRRALEQSKVSDSSFNDINMTSADKSDDAPEKHVYDYSRTNIHPINMFRPANTTVNIDK